MATTPPPADVEGTAHDVEPPTGPLPPAAPGRALEPHRPLAYTGSTELIVADSPAERVGKAAEIATALDSIIRQQGLRTKVGSMKAMDPETGEPKRDAQNGLVWVPRWHVDVEGWQTLASLLGCAIVPAWTRRILDADGRPEIVEYQVEKLFYERGTKRSQIRGGDPVVVGREVATVKGHGFEARVEVYKDGVLVGAGEAQCSRTEEKWRNDDDFALRGMAQTRATSRAVGATARWIVTLAGYSGTPSEDMPDQGENGTGPDAPPPLWTMGASTNLERLAKAELVHLVGEEEAAKVWTAIVNSPVNEDDDSPTVGFVPAIVAQAIYRTGRARRRQQGEGNGNGHQAPAAAAPAPEPESAPAEPAPEGAPAPGTVARTAHNITVHCKCPDHDGSNDECPIEGHGRPF